MWFRIKNGFCPDGRLDSRGRLVLWMRDGPFQNAMDDEVGIAANGRSEVGVLIEAEGEVAERVGGVTRLLQGAKHQVGEDALFGFAGDFGDEALVVLWRDANFRAG